MSASKVRIAAAAALAVGVALAASPASARTAVPKGSCKLLTVREVGEILGTPSDAGKQKTRSAAGITGDRCVWEAEKKGTGGLKGRPLELEVVVESGTTLVDSYQKAKAADPIESDDVPGLGDDAFVKDLKLHVLVGDRVLSTAFHNYRYPKPLTEDQIQQKEEDAARIALGRLPAA
ncbi:MAG TPA: hypothetical protein VKE97_08285 [Acidimicrobiia bacterium]|nr:hypothetical protein [Acidimicrobiia bacterium]